MNGTLWDIEAINPRGNRVLTEKESEYLHSGDPGSYTFTDMEGRVTKKVEELPDRVQLLINDICSLYYQGHIGTEESGITPDEFFDVQPRAQKVRGDPVVDTWGTYSDHVVKFGFELGSIARMVNGGPLDPDFVWGVIMGVAGESREEYDTEAEQLVRLFDELETQYESRLVAAGTTTTKDETDGLQTERQRIRDAVRENGIAPTQPVIDGILQAYLSDDYPREENDVTDSWKNDPGDFEHSEPPSEMPTPEEIDRAHINDIVEHFLDGTELRLVDHLAKDLREDAIRVQNSGWKNISAETILLHVYEHGVTQFREFPEGEPPNYSNLLHALGVLSYEDSTWVNRPAVRERPGASSYWETTPYGDLLGEVIVEHARVSDWVYNAVMKPEALNEEIRELIEMNTRSSE